MVHFGEFLKTWSLRSNSVTRQVNFNTTKISGKCKNSNATFWVIFKQCALAESLKTKKFTFPLALEDLSLYTNGQMVTENVVTVRVFRTVYVAINMGSSMNR